jgi:hypothetical protein
VRAALGTTMLVCDGTEKATNDLRQLMDDLNKGIVPTGILHSA